MPNTHLAIKSNATYDTLKYVALIVLPALAALYSSLGTIWGLPYIVEIVGTITAVDTFLGVLLRISSKQYKNDPSNYDGTIVDDGSRDIPLFEFNEPFENLVTKDEVVLKVDNTKSQ